MSAVSNSYVCIFAINICLDILIGTGGNGGKTAAKILAERSLTKINNHKVKVKHYTYILKCFCLGKDTINLKKYIYVEISMDKGAFQRIKQFVKCPHLA